VGSIPIHTAMRLEQVRSLRRIENPKNLV